MAAQRKRKTPAKTPAKRGKGELVPQPHGGAIRRGGTNRGGTGRPASEIRARMRGSLDERIAIAEQIADNPQSSDSDRLKALDFLAKYGIGTKQEHSGPDDSPIPNEIIITRRIVPARGDA